MEKPETSLSTYIPELDGLRGIAILLVIMHHFWPDTGYWTAYEKLPHLGWIGVDLFFVISGFLIGGILLDSAGKPGYYRNFYARRSLRIFPLYYAFLILLFAVIPMAQHGAYMQTEFIRQSGSPAWYFCYLGNVREAITGHEPAYFLAPLWSLSIEEQFYLLFPVIVTTLSRQTLKRLMLALVVLAPVFRTATFFAFPHNERIQYLATFSRMDVLAMGVLLALFVRGTTRQLSRKQVGWAAAIGLFLLAIAYCLNGLNRLLPFCRIAGYSLIGATFAACVLWVLLARPALFRFPVLMNVGKLCYGIYLLQRPVDVAVTKLLPHLHISLNPEGLGVFFLKIVATYCVAWCSWNLFEKHILKLKNRFVSSAAGPRAKTEAEIVSATSA